MNPAFVNFIYIIASILFILGIKMLGKAETARRGNIVSSVGMLIAVVITLFDKKIIDCSDPTSWGLLAGGLAVGAIIGAVVAKKVKMTAMPEMVALLNGFGGLASLLVAAAEYYFDSVKGQMPSDFSKFAIIATIFIGGVTFTGSVYAWGKLSGKISGKAKVYPGQKTVNAVVAMLTIAASAVFVVLGDFQSGLGTMIAVIILSLLLGIVAVMPIGGGDMPVVISLLNSLSGMAASAAGFVLHNNVLIVAGCLVGASGLILTVIMCKSMNRTLSNVLFSGFGATGSKSQKLDGEMKPMSTDDAYFVLEAAQNVVFIPGYGMAVAQAQHAVKDLAEILENNGA